MQHIPFLQRLFPQWRPGPRAPGLQAAFYDAFLARAEELRQAKPIVVCGDFNTAHTALDLKNAKANEKTSGFLPEERPGSTPSRPPLRGHLPDVYQGGRHYTWWDYRFKARDRNVGWRIDYFFVSEELRGKVRRAWIDNTVFGSDHCPVGLDLDAT